MRRISLLLGLTLVAAIGFAGSASAASGLYSISAGDNTLYNIDPADGSTISSVPITLGGNAVFAGHGLATDHTGSQCAGGGGRDPSTCSEPPSQVLARFRRDEPKPPLRHPLRARQDRPGHGQEPLLPSAPCQRHRLRHA